ncbi:MAG: sugar transferase [Ruminococcaceae bacterium]|nr:sugar transferase [Oscillospiraceae bacterium]
MKKNHSNDEYIKMTRFLASVVILIALTAVFALIWFQINAEIEVMPFAKKGHYLIIALYFALQYIFSRTYGAFRIGYYKAWDIILSQTLATMIVDVLMYAIMSLIARKLLPILPMINLFVLQLGITIIWTMSATLVYKRIYPPRRLVVVYHDRSAADLVRKMSVRDDKYHICEAIDLDRGFKEVCKCILAYDGAVIYDLPSSERNDLLKFCYVNDKRAYVTPKISDIFIRGGENIHLFDTPLLLCRNSGLTFEERFFKRLIDVVVSIVGLIFAALPMLITAIAIKAYDGGPVFFRQERVTKDGKVFKIIKFRSMKVDADEERGEAYSAMKDDDRITPVGKVIRSFRLDEFPQFLNVLKGDMSVVGPRPEMLENVRDYTEELPEFNFRHKVKAGLTGYAQIFGKYNTTAYDKLKLDLYYIENYSIRVDIRLILMTIKVLFMRESTEGFDET